MKNIRLFLLIIAASLFASNNANASFISQQQDGTNLASLDKKYLNWYNSDPETQDIHGVSVDKAYKELLSDMISKKKIVVAVIDAGIDIEHEDLKNKIWTNEGEIFGNGIDDDKNGYIDDIHGWNFIGNDKGENIMYENIEETRILRKLNPIYKDIKSIDDLAENQKEGYKLFLEIKKTHKKELEKYVSQKINIDAFEKRFSGAENVIKQHLGKELLSEYDIKKVSTAVENVMRARNYLLYLYSNGFSPKSLEGMKEHVNKYVEKHLNLDFEPRKIISDNPEDINDANYGNNDVKWERSDHGTFVAGIIAADRNNSIGIQGIADNVELMVLRTVPSGDERDKDVALSIRYAVDNGANIINMSFGKNYSPQKRFIDEAINYAEKNNVLMVHAAGNKAENMDIIERYPTNRYDDGTRAQNWITVGASAMELNKDFCGVFSNYGQKNVDLFAPGVDVLSLYPKNTYKVAGGTSFAAPVVTGVAALVWSYYPELNALELKDVLLNSCYLYPKQKVYLPNVKTDDKDKVKFKTLSLTGGVVNAYKALIYAEEFVSNKDKAMNN